MFVVDCGQNYVQDDKGGDVERLPDGRSISEQVRQRSHVVSADY